MQQKLYKDNLLLGLTGRGRAESSIVQVSVLARAVLTPSCRSHCPTLLKLLLISLVYLKQGGESRYRFAFGPSLTRHSLGPLQLCKDDLNLRGQLMHFQERVVFMFHLPVSRQVLLANQFVLKLTQFNFLEKSELNAELIFLYLFDGLLVVLAKEYEIRPF